MARPEVRIKICGITSVEDATAAVEAGADAIGLNFVAGPRQIDIDRAKAILPRMANRHSAWSYITC